MKRSGDTYRNPNCGRFADRPDSRGQFGLRYVSPDLRAFTIVELVVMSAIGAVVLGGMYMFLSAGSRQGSRLEEKLRAVQAAQIFLEYLSTDLKGARVTPGHPLRVESVSEGNRNRLSFERHDSRATSPGKLASRRVVYTFEPARHRVLRDGDPIGAACFASVSFRWHPARPAASPPLLGDTLTVLLVTAPPEALSKGEEPDPRLTSAFTQTLAVRPAAGPDVLRCWVPNAY